MSDRFVDGLQLSDHQSQRIDDHVEDDKNSHVKRKRIRIRVPVVRTRVPKGHAFTVVRRRPQPQSQLPPPGLIEPAIPLNTPNIFTKTSIKDISSFDVINNEGSDVFNEFSATSKKRHKVTVTRRRKIKPATTFSMKHRERITRKKLINVRPISKPTPTIAIITTGFYTAPSIEDVEYDDIDSSVIPTPHLELSSFTEEKSFSVMTEETIEPLKNLDQTSAIDEPIIITDNFFFPVNDEESSTNENKNVDTNVYISDETTTFASELMEVGTLSGLVIENDKNEVENKATTMETEVEITTEPIDISNIDLKSVIEESTTVINNEENKNDSVIHTDMKQSINNINNNISVTYNDSNINQTSNVTVHNSLDDISNSTTKVLPKTLLKNTEDTLRVIPISTDTTTITPSTPSNLNIITSTESTVKLSTDLPTSEIPSVVPLKTISSEKKTEEIKTSVTDVLTNTSTLSLTPEDIEASLTDDLYLSLSRPNFPQIMPSKVASDTNIFSTLDLSSVTPELETSIYYSETTVTSTRLKTYTYFVTKLNGQETEVTSSTLVRPRVTTLTVTIPVTVTMTPTQASSSVTLTSSVENITKEGEAEDEGRRFNLATRVMSNGVEVIVAGTTPAYRWENLNSQPTLTLSEAVLMLLPQDKPNEFVTKTCTTTFTYLNTITRDGTTMITTDQQVIANTATEERHRKPASEAASVTLEASPTLQTEIFKTTYTYLTLNTDHPDEKNALSSSTKVIANTVTAPQYYLNMILEPSEVQKPETNTYVSTRVLEKTYLEDGKTKIETTNDIITQLIITESALPSQPASIKTTSTTSVETVNPTTDISKTYFVTYTYFTTYLDKDNTKIKASVVTSSDIIYEKAPVKKTDTNSVSVTATPEPIQIFATKTYLTTYTYFTTLLQAGVDGETSTTVTSRTHVVENVITESIAPSLLDAGYMNTLLTTSHHSDSLKNVVTGSTIIFFDDEEQINPTPINSFVTSPSTNIDKIDNNHNSSIPTLLDSIGSETNDSPAHVIEPDNYNDEVIVEDSTNSPSNKKPSQVSNLLSLGSLGINSLTALGPVITAMAGLLQGKTPATRRNDTESVTESQITTTQRSPIYIPVAEFVDGDIETAESQNIALHLPSNNHLLETRHKVTSNLADGIPISPGEIITANSDVIIGKPGKMGPRPPQTYLNDKTIGMKPPPVSVPNIPTHPVLEVVENELSKNIVKVQKIPHHLEILPAQQIYEEHIKIPIIPSQSKATTLYNPQQIFTSFAPKKISSKQDILENDPLLTPPLLSSKVNTDLNNNSEKSRYPWSPKDPLSAANVLNEEKNRLFSTQKDSVQIIDSSLIKSRVPEPIVHQVPHVIDRSTGQPLLVNIQPSQVANVVIPQGGTKALIFGDTNEPHVTGQYFDDPSPYPEPEVGPGFIGLDKVENLAQYSKNDKLADYMTPPSLPTDFRLPQKNSNARIQSHLVPFSQGLDFKHINAMSKPEKLPNKHHDRLSGQSQVHTEILVHHNTENLHSKPQTRPVIPIRNYQSLQIPSRRDQTKIHISPEQVPPRRTEIPPSPVENTFYNVMNAPLSNFNWENEKRPLHNSQIRRPRPTSRPRYPTRITGHPYAGPMRIDRPLGPVRQPPFSHTQRLPSNTYQHEFHNYNRFQSTILPFAENNQKFTSEVNNQPNSKDKIFYAQQESNKNIYTSQDIDKQSAQDSGNYEAKDYYLTTELENKNVSSMDEKDDNKKYEKPLDSEVDASEDIKVISKPQDNENKNDLDIPIEFSHNIYVDDSNINNNSTVPEIILYDNSSDESKNNQNKTEESNYASENKQDQTVFITTLSNAHNKNTFIAEGNIDLKRNPIYSHEIKNFQSASKTPVIELNGHSRPYSKPHFVMTQSEGKLESAIETMKDNHNKYHGHRQQSTSELLGVQIEKNNREHHKNDVNLNVHRDNLSHTTRVHPDHRQIITKSKAQVPGPVIVSSGMSQKHNNQKQSTMKFSLPIDSKGEENDSKTQTERPPNMDTVKNYQKFKEESLDTAYQTNFASADFNDEKYDDKKIHFNTAQLELSKLKTQKIKPLSPHIIPLSVGSLGNNNDVKNNQMNEGLKPPPLPTDVFGLSPPPVDITTTTRSENKQNQHKIVSNVSGLKPPPPAYISLKESNATLPLPSTNMVPPSLKSSIIRPYLADILTQDMVPPPQNTKTTRPLEVATIRPGVAVSGSIQIATAVATSHIPVVHDMESKIPIVHGTVDLPIVVNVPPFLKTVNTTKTNRVSAYTVQPFETRQRITIRPTSVSSLRSSSYSTLVKQPQVFDTKPLNNSNNHYLVSPTSSILLQVSKTPKPQEPPVTLEPSTEIHLVSTTTVEPTEILIIENNTHDNNENIKQKTIAIEVASKTSNIENSKTTGDLQNNARDQELKKNNLKIKESASKMMEIIGTVVHEFIQNSTNEKVKISPQEITRYETLTVTRTETSVVGSPPTTRTLLITHTSTSVRVETVTKTLLHPTSVVSTITSTILQSITHAPNYENGNDNESIFVVMSDQKPPNHGAEEVEAEYGEEDVSRDEQEVSGNDIHRVLSGGILGAPSVPIRPPQIQCIPECKASKSEMCVESKTGMHCICRPGFARLFADRPCKPTYTFTVGIGLDKVGSDRFAHQLDTNDTSEYFKLYAQPVKEALDRTLMQSDLRDMYRDLNIAKFLPNPMRVLFNVQFSSNTNEATLKDVFRKYLMMSNYSLGGTDVFASPDPALIEAYDFDECTNEEGGLHHDCSPNAMCFNIKGSYQCSCKEGWSDLSENSAYPGRVCSQASTGCAMCNNKGHCVVNTYGQEICECFPWHSGKKCQINLKVLLIALITSGVILLGLLAACLGLACLRNPRKRRRRSADQRAMISGIAGDTSSEGSVTELAIPHHVPHILPPPPQMLAPAPPLKKAPRKSSGKLRRELKKPAPVIAPVVLSKNCSPSEQRDRSLTVMIPRARYRSTAQPSQCRPAMSTFMLEEHKLMEYLETGVSLIPAANVDDKELESSRIHKQQQQQQQQQQSTYTSGGALVSAGFQVSAQVRRTLDAESTLGGESVSEDALTSCRGAGGGGGGGGGGSGGGGARSLVRSCAETSVQPPTKQLLRLELAEVGSSSLARSCAETSIQPASKVADSASEGHTMAERELGSTLRLPAHHAPLYHPDRTSTDRESNFDSL